MNKEFPQWLHGATTGRKLLLRVHGIIGRQGENCFFLFGFLNSFGPCNCNLINHSPPFDQKAFAEIREGFHHYESASIRGLPVQVYCWWTMEVCPWHALGPGWNRQRLQHFGLAGNLQLSVEVWIWEDMFENLVRVTWFLDGLITPD